ncbi:MAG: SanA/YdcF family protein [Chitinophagales bacterium]
MSGDHGTTDYDEVNAMKDYLIDKGVPKSDIFLDHAGFNTYNSVIRAKKVFEVDNLVIVSQDYHLPRAVFIAQYSGMEVYGFASSSAHLGATKRNKIREFLARIKSFLEIAIDIPPQYLGDVIPITGDSQLSFD